MYLIAIVVLFIIVLGLSGCVSMPKIEDYQKISFLEFQKALVDIQSTGRPPKQGHGFIVEGYIQFYDGQNYLVNNLDDDEKIFINFNYTYRLECLNVYGNYNCTTYHSHQQMANYSEDTLLKHIDRTKKITMYVGFYHNVYNKQWEACIDKIDRLRTSEEVAAIEVEQAQREEEQKAIEEAAKAEQEKILDEKAETISTGYTYHGITENTQNGKLFNSGALEDGHAYYVSSFMIGEGGLTGGVITSLLVDPTYHVVEYVNQKIKGDVVSASQTTFGTLPVKVVIAGGKPPLYIPIILGLIE
jgi:hypothetical protein